MKLFEYEYCEIWNNDEYNEYKTVNWNENFHDHDKYVCAQIHKMLASVDKCSDCVNNKGIKAKTKRRKIF